MKGGVLFLMNLFSHLSIHLFFAFLAGLIAWRIYKKSFTSFFGGFFGGFLIDFDHCIDYFLAFGPSFKLEYFIQGYQFLKSDKIYVLFHAWEYGILLMLASFLFKNKILRSAFLGLALGLFFHLITDVFIDKMPPASYLIIKRIESNFETRKLVYPENWEQHLRHKDIAKSGGIIK